MSRYATNRILWETIASPELAEQLKTSPDEVLSSRDLSDDERAALAAQDIRALYLTGAHPFLLYNFALRMEGSFSFPFVDRYLAQLEGLPQQDLMT